MKLEELLAQYPKHESSLIDILLEATKESPNHCVDDASIKTIASHVGVSESKVCGVLSFYTLLSAKPKGKYVIQVCRDIPCHVHKQSEVVSTLEQILGVSVGETTPNGLFSIEYASCLGHCDESPAMRLNGRTYVRLTPDKVKTIIAEYRGNA
jgi:NADH-quinone oxidoreductase subunit E